MTRNEGEGVMEDLLARIQKAFHGAFDVEPQSVSLDTQPDDVPGWDSMGHVTLASSLEREFAISFDVDELMAMENVREIVRIVKSKITPTTA
jgi:acyl carrier protein